MADTARTTAALLALLADNASGNISAQDMRDVLASLADHGEQSLTIAGSPATMSAVGTTPTLVNIANTSSDATSIVTGGMVSALSATYDITPGVTGVYLLGFSTSIELAQANKIVTFTPFINGSAGLVNASVEVPVQATTATISYTEMVSLTADQPVDMRVSIDSGTSDIDFIGWSFWIDRVG